LTRWKVKTGEWWDEGAFAVGTTLAGMAAWKRSRRAAVMDEMTLVMVEVVGGRAGGLADESDEWRGRKRLECKPATSCKPFRGSAGRAGRVRMWIL